MRADSARTAHEPEGRHNNPAHSFHAMRFVSSLKGLRNQTNARSQHQPALSGVEGCWATIVPPFGLAFLRLNLHLIACPEIAEGNLHFTEREARYKRSPARECWELCGEMTRSPSGRHKKRVARNRRSPPRLSKKSGAPFKPSFGLEACPERSRRVGLFVWTTILDGSLKKTRVCARATRRLNSSTLVVNI